MKVIWKFPFYGIHATARTGEDPKAVLFGKDPGNQICIWVEALDTDKPLYETHYQIFGTGHRIPRDAEYVDSFVDPDGFVWHAYKVA